MKFLYHLVFLFVFWGTIIFLTEQLHWNALLSLAMGFLSMFAIAKMISYYRILRNKKDK